MVAVDTNVLVYAEGIGDRRRMSIAEDLLRRMRGTRPHVPVQVLGELFRVLVRKGGIAPGEAVDRVRRYEMVADLLPSAPSTLSLALELARDHALQIFDALVLAASAEGGCRVLLSEDMQDGFVWRGVTVVNPFAQTLHPLLADVMAHPARARHDRPRRPDNTGGTS